MTEGAWRIERVTVGKWRVNCYLVHDGAAGIVIDPGDEADVLATRIESARFAPLAIVNTHGHFDHVGAVAALKERYRIPFYLHSGDKRLMTHANLYRSMAGDATIHPTPAVDHVIDGLPRLQIGPLALEVLETPGHTAGGVCFRLGSTLFTGDTLFSAEVGRTDLPGGSRKQLEDSLALLARQPDADILPGHGPGRRLTEALAAVRRGDPA
jgi:hydroxyacylglutathione hydrolase